MTRILREAAVIRDELERTRSSEDTRLARQESEAWLAMIRRRGSGRTSG